MTEILLYLIAVVALAILVLVVLFRPRTVTSESGIAESLAAIPLLVADVARLRDDLRRSEQAARDDAKAQRQELTTELKYQRQELADAISKWQTNADTVFGRLGSGLAEQIKQLTDSSGTAADSLSKQLNERLDSVAKLQADAAVSLRGEVTRRLDAAATTQQQSSADLQKVLNDQLVTSRKEITDAVGALSKANTDSLSGIALRVSGQLDTQTKSAGENLERLRTTVDNKLENIQKTASERLDQMRATVDEKLTSTLNSRFAENFKLVSERLDAVKEGLGEMKNLAGNVTDLRRVMTNVKTRGVWGEVQLANLLDQIFTKDQYEINFKPKSRGGEVVEFALKLPGPEGSGVPVYLPIDSKFPIEDYQRLADAAEIGDVVAVKAAQKALENRIYGCAKDIRDKYIAVPTTTNFAVLFLPTEALYAEVIKMPGLMETLTREYKVVVQGPTTFSAFAMALLMGFRTLAIQQRAAGIADLLGAVKSDFGKFSDLLGKVEEKLDDAKSNIGKARQRSTQIVKKLGKVEELPQERAALLLPDPTGDPDAILADDQD